MYPPRALADFSGCGAELYARRKRFRSADRAGADRYATFAHDAAWPKLLWSICT